MSRSLGLGAALTLAAAMLSVSNGSGATQVGQPTAALDDWVSVDAALTQSGDPTQTCGIRTDGSLWCWGVNASGELGLGDTKNRYQPAQVGGATDWVSVSNAESNTCAIEGSGTLWCWGLSFASDVPKQVGSATNWTSIGLGGDHTLSGGGSYYRCGVRADSSLWCWGNNSFGQLGVGDYLDRADPTQVGTDWATVSTGSEHTCGVRLDGTLWCWGGNSFGELGIGPGHFSVEVPTQVDPGSRWDDVAAGGTHSCGVHQDGSAWCWGQGSYGQLGNDNQDNQYVPVRVGTRVGWSSMATGYAHTCATRADSTLWCWGLNQDGAVGIGRPPETQMTPARVGSALWDGVAAGGRDSCGVQSDHTLWCWGSPAGGELGVGNRNRHTDVPVQVGLPNGPVPTSYSLSGVDALSSDDVWAVGNTQRKSVVKTFVERWDGSSWQRLPAVDLGRYSAFDSVAAVASTDVWAAGAFRNTKGDHPLLEHWDGATWTRDPVGDAIVGRLAALSVIADDDIWAVGYQNPETYYSIPLILHYDGTRWSVVHAAKNPGWSTQRFTDVDVLSANDVWAVGYGRQDDEAGYLPLAEHWDGQAWSNVPVAFGHLYDDHFLRGVAAVSPRDVWALGDRTMTSDYNHELALARHWTGSRWAQVAVPDPGVDSGTYLRAADATGSNDVWSVGETNEGAKDRAFTVHYDGQRWTQVATPNPPGPVDVQLSDVDAQSSSDVWAVGSSNDSRKAEPLVEQWDGTSWVIVQDQS